MRSVIALAAVLSVGVLAAPSIPVNFTVSDIVRAGNHLDMAEDTVTEWDGTMYTFQPGTLPQRLVRVRGLTTARAVPTTAGGYDLLQRELFLYYLPDTDVLAHTFTSPWDGQTYPGDRMTVTVSSTSNYTNPLNSNPSTNAVLEPFSGNLTTVTALDTTTYTFPSALLPQVGKPQSLSNVTISRTRITPVLPFMNAPADIASRTTLLLILTGRKVDEGIDGLSQVLQDQLENGKLWAYEDAPVSRDDVGSGAQKSAANGTNDWMQFATSAVFNPWRMGKSDAFPLQDIGDWCDA